MRGHHRGRGAGPVGFGTAVRLMAGSKGHDDWFQGRDVNETTGPLCHVTNYSANNNKTDICTFMVFQIWWNKI